MFPSAASSAENVLPRYCTQSITRGSVPLFRTLRRADDSKDAVATGDETPVGTMMALAAASLLAGGYVLVRRRKKEI